MLRVTIGLTHYDGPACEMNFVDSVCVIDLKEDDSRIKRLISIYPETKVEVLSDEEAKRVLQIVPVGPTTPDQNYVPPSGTLEKQQPPVKIASDDEDGFDFEEDENDTEDGGHISEPEDDEDDDAAEQQPHVDPKAADTQQGGDGQRGEGGLRDADSNKKRGRSVAKTRR